MSEILQWAWWALALVIAFRITKSLRLIANAMLVKAGADHMKADNEQRFFSQPIEGVVEGDE